MPTQINALNCAENQGGLGLVDCEIKFKDIFSILVAVPSWTFNPESETFNDDYVVSKIQDRTFAPFLNTMGFTDNTPDPTTFDYPDGTTAVVRNGKPTYSFEYDNGVKWHQAAYSFNGFKKWSVILIDRQGNVFLQQVSATQLKGFLTGMFNTRTYRMATTTEPARTVVEFQISNEEAFNRDAAVITRDTIGSDLNEVIKGITDVTLTASGGAGGDITVVVESGNNSTFGIEGLPLGSFRVTNLTDNVVYTITGISYGANQWTYILETTEPLVNLDLMKVEMYDAEAAEPVALIEATNTLYYGSTTFTVAAST